MWIISWEDIAEAIMNTARTFVVSAQDIFRAGVVTIANKELALDVVGDATKLADSMRSIKVCSPDLIILDLQDCDLQRELPQLRHDQTIDAKTLVITSVSTDYELTQCLQYGVNGIVCRNATRGEMVTAIRKVLTGRAHYCSHTSLKLRKDFRANSLTKRELEVLQFLALGLPNKEIAERLAVGIGTVKTHLININSKLNAATRTEAVVRGVQQRLISI